MFPLLSKPLVLYRGPKIILYHKCKKIRKMATFFGSSKKAQSAKKGTRIEANGAVNCTLQ